MTKKPVPVAGDAAAWWDSLTDDEREGREATVTETEHVLATRRAGCNKDGFPVVAASCPCGWEHMTAHNPARYESERDAITYLAYRYNDAHKQGREESDGE